MSVSRISKDLGVNENSLYKWKRDYLEDQQNAFPGKGKMKPEEEELKNLRKELAIVKMERDILKKAISFFAKEKE
jgi:transposase